MRAEFEIHREQRVKSIVQEALMTRQRINSSQGYSDYPNSFAAVADVTLPQRVINTGINL